MPRSRRLVAPRAPLAALALVFLGASAVAAPSWAQGQPRRASDLAAPVGGVPQRIVYDAAGRFAREEPVEYRPEYWGAVRDDGVDDRASIQAAIDAASAAASGGLGGATVRLAQGVYDVSYLPAGSNNYYGIVLKPGVTLTGGTLRLRSSQATSATGKYYLVSNLDGAGGGYPNVTIDGVVIDANGANNQAFTVADAVTLVGDNVALRNSYVKDAPDSGVMFSAVTNSTVENNRVEGYTASSANDVGVYVNDGGSVDADGRGSTFSENLVTGNRITGFRFGGIALKRNLSRCIVSLNQIYNTGAGITFENASTSSDYSTDNLIVGNRLRRIGYLEAAAAKRGIDVRRARHVQVIGNRIEDSLGNGIVLSGASDNTVTGNTVSFVAANATAGDHRGIWLTERDGVAPTNNTFTANVITGGAWQIDMNTQGTVPVTGNVVVGNVLTGGVVGIRISSTSVGNSFVANTASASSADYSYTATLGANAWLGNRATGTATIAGGLMAANLDYPAGGTYAVGAVRAGAGVATEQVTLGNLGLAAPAVGFGTSNDVKLYRSAANVLALESGDAFRVQGAGYVEVGGPRWLSGSGSPEGVVTAPVGSFYSRTDGGAGTSWYVKESGSGSGGWVAK